MIRAELYLADWRSMPALPPCSVLLSDPPYGVNYAVNARTGTALGGMETVTEAKPPIAGDAADFDPTPFLAAASRVALFGAQHFSEKLPRGRWLVWDKRRDGKPDDHSDGELIWMTGDSRRALRIHRQKWRGIIREGEENCSRSRKLHPNQKPVALIDIILDHLEITSEDVVLDPFMGSGSTGVAALRRGARFVGIEIDPAHFTTAHARLVSEFGPQAVAVLDLQFGAELAA